jgi:septal ring factor EnvC (AmiA/AmiB activator)
MVRTKKEAASVIYVSSSEEKETSEAAPVRQRRPISGCRRKRVAKKSKFPIVFTDSDSDEEISKAVYMDIRREWKRIKVLLDQSNKEREKLEAELGETQQALKYKETVLKALRSGVQKKMDEIISSSLRIGALEEKIERLLTEVIPHVYQTTISDPDEGKKLVELAAKPGVRAAELLPEDSFDGSNYPDDPVSD